MFGEVQENFPETGLWTNYATGAAHMSQFLSDLNESDFGIWTVVTLKIISN